MKSGNILIYHIGQLGDTLCSVPALKVIRNLHPDAKITLLCDKHIRSKYINASDILGNSGLADEFMFYPASYSKKEVVKKFLKSIRLLLQLRLCDFDMLYYLVPSRRTSLQIRRDLLFFRLAGIKRVIGKDICFPSPYTCAGEPLTVLPHESDLLLARLAASGIPVPSPGKGIMDINISDKEVEYVEGRLKELIPGQQQHFVAVAPSSKMPVKKWPPERYISVVKKLIDEFDIWPIIFGDQNDAILAGQMLAAWGRGSSVAGIFNIRQSIAAMSKCLFYLGNDTGSMHMAVSAGLKCVAIFSSRDYPGKWYPSGKGHHVFRTPIDCEGCMLVDCVERRMKCIMSITTEQVYQGCFEYLTRQTTEN